MSKIIFFSLFALLLFINADCKDDPIKPVDIKPGRRDYIWTVDTLFTRPGDIIYGIFRIWGSSPENVWMIATADAGYELWHYNGSNWLRDSMLLQIEPTALFGFSINDVWMSNISSGANFWHFDGVSWKFFSEQKVGNFGRVALQNINGTGSNNIYAVGFADTHPLGNIYKGIVFHFDGNKWNEVKIEEQRISYVEVFTNDNNLFLSGTRYESGYPDTNKIFIYKNSKLYQIYSDIYFTNMTKIGNTIYVNYNKKIFVFDNDKGLILWKDFSSNNYLGGITGRSEKDIFGIGKSGLVHYNGTDLETIFPTSNNYLSSITLFESDIFFGIDDYSTGKHFMVRGTLKN
jgi:hypothetical protein